MNAGEKAPTAEQWGAILNLSGRQRMLTQKMSKETLLIVAEIDVRANRDALAHTTTLFETTLAGLRDGDATLNLPPTNNERILTQLDEVATLYDTLRPIFTKAASGGDISTDELKTLADNNTILLSEMNKVVKMYERLSKTTLAGDESMAIVINLAGKQRMLTQKMTKEYLLVHLGIEVEKNRLNIRETSTLFDNTLKGLLNGDKNLDLPRTNDQDIRAQLQVVAELWSHFHPVVNKASSHSDTLTAADLRRVADDNVPLLNSMNTAVTMFEKLAR